MEMVHMGCEAHFQIFTPFKAYHEGLHVLMACSGSHTHPVPFPTSTPAIICNVIFDLLHDMGQDLPDATPRWVLCNTTVWSQLHQLLLEVGDPLLINLHVSLANKDHLCAYIKQAKHQNFLEGTDLEGVSLYMLISLMRCLTKMCRSPIHKTCPRHRNGASRSPHMSGRTASLIITHQ